MLAALCVFYSACDNGDQLPGDKSPVRIDTDWSSFSKNVPSGMTILLHNCLTGEKSTLINNSTSHSTTRLSSGKYWATAFNLSEDEFNNICFTGLKSPQTAEAVLNKQPSPEWYNEYNPLNNYVAGQPEWLAVDTILTADVEPNNQQTAQIGTLHPKNIIYTLHLTLTIDNIDNLIAARCAVSGFASGRKLAALCPNNNGITVSHIVKADRWTCSRLTEHSGLINAEIQCFGLPSNHTAQPDENNLLFQALLADGKTIVTYNLPVGHLINITDTNQSQRGDNLNLSLDLKLEPALPAPAGDGGIDVWVDDWDDHLDLNMPL